MKVCVTGASGKVGRATVIDLRDYSAHRRWHVLREGALARSAVRETLTSLA